MCKDIVKVCGIVWRFPISTSFGGHSEGDLAANLHQPRRYSGEPISSSLHVPSEKPDDVDLEHGYYEVWSTYFHLFSTT